MPKESAAKEPSSKNEMPLDSGAAQQLKQSIAAHAAELGFDLVRFTSAHPFPEAQTALEERIDAGLYSGLSWFTRERASIAGDAHNLMPSVRTIVSLGISYLNDDFVAPSEPGVPRGRVARYAWGLDYHEVFAAKLRALHAYAQEMAGAPVEMRALVDTARIVDRAVAARAGLGWYGKNTNLLNRERGSWTLLGELLLDVELPPDSALKTTCGSCAACMPACPTGALIAPGVLDNNRCISYLTIEHRGAVPRDLRPLIGDWIFGCDVCQEVCPVNRKARPGNHSEFRSQEGIGGSPDLLELLKLSKEEFTARFRRSPVKRAKWEGLKRNVCIALGNNGDPAAVPSLIKTLADPSAVVRRHAAWALGRIGGELAAAALEDRLEIEDDGWVMEEISLALDEIGSGRERNRDVILV